MRSSYALMVAALFTFGCADVGVEEQGTASDLFGVVAGGKPSLNYLYEAVFPLATAEFVADQCPRLRVNSLEENRLAEEIAQRMISEGYTEHQFNAIMQNFDNNTAFVDKLNADEAAFVKRHGIVAGDPETYCAAGRAEMRAGSEVGEFLKGTG